MPPNDFITSQDCQEILPERNKSFDPRYLAAKKAIDDRALNYHVWQTLRENLPQTTGSEPVNILEIGAGIGTMLERMVDRNVLTGPVIYVATDNDPDQLRAARQYLSSWAGKMGHTLSWLGEHQGQLCTTTADISLRFELSSAEQLADRSTLPGNFHLLIAHAVLDLVDFPVLLPRLLTNLTNHGLAYFTCNFDGETLFLPECSGDERIIELYHGSMETRLAGASHTGRRLLTFVQRPGLELLAAGSSDWVIHPRNGHYLADEIFFLHTIIETVELELKHNPNSPSDLAHWARLRHGQVEAGELTFLARHLDLLVRQRLSLP